MDAGSYREFATAIEIIETISSKDSQTSKSVISLREETAGLHAQLDSQRAEQEKTVVELEKRQKQMQGWLSGLAKQYEAVKSKFDDSKSGFIFPVKAPYSFVDSYGLPAPRLPKARGNRHIRPEGNSGDRGGQRDPRESRGSTRWVANRLWLRSPGDNWTYYYAHLNAFAAGMRDGVKVKKGQVLGYVGVYRQRRRHPPHLHFETHVPSGGPTNPYPILRRVKPDQVIPTLPFGAQQSPCPASRSSWSAG